MLNLEKTEVNDSKNISSKQLENFN